jgi:hypothetical protein
MQGLSGLFHSHKPLIERKNKDTKIMLMIKSKGPPPDNQINNQSMKTTNLDHQSNFKTMIKDIFLLNNKTENQVRNKEKLQKKKIF